MNDNFRDPFNEVEKPEPPKQETPEEREEREIKDATIDRRFNRRNLLVGGIVAAVVLAIILTLHYVYFSPYVTGSQVTGYIMEMDNKGSVFKTYECKMVAKEFIVDTLHSITTDFNFTIRDDSLARQAMELKGTGHRVRITYDEYHGWLPWRGDTKRFARAIEVRDSL